MDPVVILHSRHSPSLTINKPLVNQAQLGSTNVSSEVLGVIFQTHEIGPVAAQKSAVPWSLFWVNGIAFHVQMTLVIGMGHCSLLRVA